jgi:hypothetical protein
MTTFTNITPAPPPQLPDNSLGWPAGLVIQTYQGAPAASGVNHLVPAPGCRGGRGRAWGATPGRGRRAGRRRAGRRRG